MNRKEEIKKDKRRIVITVIVVLSIVAISIVIFCIICKISQTNDTPNNKKESSIEVLYQLQNQNGEENTKLGKTSDWELILVNQDNKMPEDYKTNLKEIEMNYEVDERIAESLENMLNDARKEGLKPIICSAYRTKKYQTDLYNKKVKEYKRKGYNQKIAEEKASTWVAIPSTGEHETGLSVDIVSENYQILDEEQETRKEGLKPIICSAYRTKKYHTGEHETGLTVDIVSENYQIIDEEQEKTKEQKWLIENCYKYGFILRYPTEKREITKINYEPWHYRYVGIENAKFIKEKDMCLEEYIEYLCRN